MESLKFVEHKLNWHRVSLKTILNYHLRTIFSQTIGAFPVYYYALRELIRTDDLALFSNYCYIFLSPRSKIWLHHWNDIFCGTPLFCCAAHSMSVESIWNALKSKRHMLADWNCYFFFIHFFLSYFHRAGFRRVCIVL